MAKSSVTAPVPASVLALPFKIETGVEMPEVTRLAPGGKVSPYTETMKSMSVASGAAMQSFFIPSSVPAAITDPAEREKAAKDSARKITNAVSGLARRLVKQQGATPSKDWGLRTRTENGTLGVRVYCIAPRQKEAPAAP